MNEEEHAGEDWWATGDMPVRDVPRVALLVDGRMTMLAMCLAFLCARRSISITAWGLSPELLLVRGRHKSAGPAGSPEQEELVAWLRAKGLAEDELRFWHECQELSVSNVLGRAAGKGVDVRVLLWETYALPFVQTLPTPKHVQETLEPLGIRCVLDDSQKQLLKHPLVAQHQKTAIIDGRLAFVGGIDLLVETGGDYDRWDTKGHPFDSPLRTGKDGQMPHSWHDVDILFEGPAAADVERNFRQRWNAVVSLHELDASLLLPETATAVPTAAPSTPYAASQRQAGGLQVTRTIPKGIYRFAPQDGLATIVETYRRAFSQAKRYIYLENQYFWRRTFLGFENPTLGLPQQDMDELFQALAEALTRGVVVTLLLPDNPNVGREFTDDGLNSLWELAPHAVASGALQAFTLASSRPQDQSRYRSIYVHAKTTIVDDVWFTLGSANLNNRGMRDDTELNVAIVHPELAQRLRIFLMAEHLGLCDADLLFQLLDALDQVRLSESGEQAAPYMHRLKHWFRSRQHSAASPAATPRSDRTGMLWQELECRLADPFKGLASLATQAQENLLAIKAGQPLVGHLLPYVPSSRAQDYGLEVHAANGWVDTLSILQKESAPTK